MTLTTDPTALKERLLEAATACDLKCWPLVCAGCDYCGLSALLREAAVAPAAPADPENELRGAMFAALNEVAAVVGYTPEPKRFDADALLARVREVTVAPDDPRLRELSAKWREWPASLGTHGYSRGLHQCADDLDALLTGAAELAKEPAKDVDLRTALTRYEEFHHDCFVTGRPLSIDGKNIDHTKFNEAHRLAQIALSVPAFPEGASEPPIEP